MAGGCGRDRSHCAECGEWAVDCGRCVAVQRLPAALSSQSRWDWLVWGATEATVPSVVSGLSTVPSVVQANDCRRHGPRSRRWRGLQCILCKTSCLIAEDLAAGSKESNDTAPGGRGSSSTSRVFPIPASPSIITTVDRRGTVETSTCSSSLRPTKTGALVRNRWWAAMEGTLVRHRPSRKNLSR